jgi:hypothetical protein
MASSTIRSVPYMLGFAPGKSSLINERRAAKTFKFAATENGVLDHVVVTSKSSELVLTILYNHVNMGIADGNRMLSKDSMSAMIQGLQRVYDKAGHEGNWTVQSEGKATGNPTRGNIQLSRLRRSHRSRLAEFGRTTILAMPLTEEHVIEHYNLALSETPAAYVAECERKNEKPTDVPVLRSKRTACAASPASSKHASQDPSR